MGYLSGFINNLPDLKLSMWQGNVVLKNLQIKEGAFADQLPFRVVGGWIQELHITIPWSSLTSTPVQVWVKRVDINVAFGDKKGRGRSGSGDAPKPRSSGAEAHPFVEPSIVVPVVDESATDGGWTGSIAAKIVNNVEIKAESVTIRVFDTESEDSATIFLGILHLYSCDPSFAGRLFNDPSGLDYMRKMCRVEDVSLEIHLASSTEASNAVFSGVSATLRLEKIGSLRTLKMYPSDSPTMRIDVRLSEIAALVNPEQFSFLLKATLGLLGESDPSVDPVEAALKKTATMVNETGPGSVSPRTRPGGQPAVGTLVDVPIFSTPVKSVPPPQASPPPVPAAGAGAAAVGGWVGWLLGGTTAQAQQPGSKSTDLLNFSDQGAAESGQQKTPSSTTSGASSTGGVLLTAVGVFVQRLSVTLVNENSPPLKLQLAGCGVESFDGVVIVGVDSVGATFGEQVILSVRSSAPVAVTPPVEQWAFELFASQKGEGSRSVGIDASVRLFLPNSLFDPNGFRVAVSAGISQSDEKHGQDDDAAYVVGEFGMLEHTPKKTNRFNNEKPLFRASGRQPEWQRGCHVTALPWHSFEAVLLRFGGPLPMEARDWKRFGSRPLHHTLSVCLDYVHATLSSECIASAYKFFFKHPSAAAAAEPNEWDEGLDAFAPDFDLLLDRFLSRVWRRPPVSVEVRVAAVVGVMQSALPGFPNTILRATKVKLTDNAGGQCFPGADFISLSRTYKLNPRFAAHMGIDALRRFACTNWTISASAPSVLMADTAILSAAGDLQVTVALSRSIRLWDYFSVLLKVDGGFSAAFAPQHLSYFAHCLNVLTGSTRTPLPRVPYPKDVMRIVGSDFLLELSPDVVAASVCIKSLIRDGYGAVMMPKPGGAAAAAMFSLSLGNALKDYCSTLSKGFWRAPVVEVVLHSAVVALDHEAVFGWLLDGLQIVYRPPDDVLPGDVASPLGEASPVPFSLYEMLGWSWSLSVKDVEVHLRRGLALSVPSLEMRRDAADLSRASHVMAARGLGLGSLFGKDGLEMEVKVVCSATPFPRVEIAVDWSKLWIGRLSTEEIEHLLEAIEDVSAHLDGRRRYPHCWGEAILASSLPVVPVPPAAVVWIDFELAVSVASLHVGFSLGSNAEILCKSSALKAKVVSSRVVSELFLDTARVEAVLRSEEKRQLFVSCARFVVSDSVVNGDRSFKLEVFSLVADRLDFVSPTGLPESADTILKSMDVVATRHVERALPSSDTKDMIMFEKPSGTSIPLVVATVSPCQLKLDAVTVATIKSLLASLSQIKTPETAESKRAVTSSSAPSVASLPPAQALAFQIDLASLTVWFAASKGHVSSLLEWSDIVASFSPDESALTVKSFAWRTEQGKVLMSSAANLPFVHLSAVVGADVMVDVASVKGEIGTPVVEALLSVIQASSSSDTMVAAPRVVVSEQLDLPHPSPFPSILSVYARVKVLVAPLRVKVVSLNGSCVDVSFLQIFVSSSLVDGVHVGSATMVDFCVRSSLSHECLLEPLTIMAELSFSPVYLEVAASVTHPLRAHLRPSDYALMQGILQEVFVVVGARALEPSSPPAPAAPVRRSSIPEADWFVRVSDVVASLALVGNAEGRRPEAGECVLGMEASAFNKADHGSEQQQQQQQQQQQGIISFVNWKFRTPHALVRVFQRHAVQMPESNCVAAVHVQYWDAHAGHFTTAGSLLLASSSNDGFGSNQCVFPLTLAAVRETEWRLACQLRHSSGAPLSGNKSVIAPQLLFSALGVDGAWVPGESSLSLVVPAAMVYLSHSYVREADGVAEEEEVLVVDAKRLRVSHTTGDARSSFGVLLGLKCVQFDDLTLVDVVEPFSLLAVHLRSVWDVRLSRLALNFSPLLCGTVARYAALWTRALEGGRSEMEFAYYVLHNLCTVPFMYGQLDTDEALCLEPQGRTKYSWQSGIGAPRSLKVWLLDEGAKSAVVHLDMDAILADEQESGEVQVELGLYCIWLKVNRPASSLMRKSREITFLGSYLVHSMLASLVTVRLAASLPNVQPQTLKVGPNASLGLVVATDVATHTTASLAVAVKGGGGNEVVYSSTLALKPANDESGGALLSSSRRVLMEAPGSDFRFWACQVGSRLSLMPVVTVWNCTPCALSFVCGSVSKLLAPEESCPVDRLDLKTSTLRFTFDGKVWSNDVAVTMDGLLAAAAAPQTSDLVCGNHSVTLSIHSEKMYGGLVAVLFAPFVVKNETMHELELFAGLAPKLPQDRAALKPDCFSVAPCSLRMLKWGPQSAEVSCRLLGSKSVDDWTDVVDGTVAPELTLRGERLNGDRDEYLRHPFVAQFDRVANVTPSSLSSKAVLPWTTLRICARMVLHSKIDFEMLVRIGCGNADHGRCLSGQSFLLAPRSERELTGFRFGFHVSVSFDKGSSWSEQVLIGKETPSVPLPLLRSGPPMLLCYSVVADSRGTLHTTIMRDTTPPLCVRNECSFDVQVATLQSQAILVQAGSCVSVPPQQDSATKLILSHPSQVGRRSAPVLVESDGDGTVKLLDVMLYFRISSVMGSRLMRLAEVPYPVIPPIVSTGVLGRLVVVVHEMSVSLFDEKAEAECVRLSVSQLTVDVGQRCNPNVYSPVKTLIDLSFSAGVIQIDNHTEELCEFPVVLASTALVKPSASSAANNARAMLHVRTSFGFCDEGLHVDECIVALQPVSVFVGEAFVLYAQQQLTALLQAVNVPEPKRTRIIDLTKRFDQVDTLHSDTVQLIENETTKPPFIRYLKVSAIQLRVTLHFNLDRVHLYLGMDDSPISVSEVVMNDLASLRLADLVRNLVSLYVADMVVRSPSLLGSLQILGNPTSFVSSVIDGVYDLLSMPMRGVRDMNPLNTVLGIGRGSASFVRHLSVGTLKSFSGWFGSVSKSMDMLTLDEAYVLKQIRERSLASRAGLGDALATGLVGLGSAVLDGLVGVVAMPLRGAQENGVRGFLAGSARGALSVVLKPLGGALELVSRAAHGALVSAGGGSFALRRAPPRKRRARVVLAELRWRRKLPGFRRAFDCAEALVLLTTDEALFVVRDVVVDRLPLAENFVFQEIYSAGSSSFKLGKWTLTLVHRSDRREFAQAFKK